MKKALVLAIVCALGLGFGAVAGPLTGTWTTSLSINPNFQMAGVNLFSSFSTSLKLAYTVGGWTFGSTSTFGISGFSSQVFSTKGALGAFTFDSTMAFAPMLVTAYAYPGLSPAVVFPGAGVVQTPANICSLWVKVPATYGPAFLYWKAIGSVSIAGVNFEALFYQNKNALASYVEQNALFMGTAPVQTGSVLVQTSSTVCSTTAFNGVAARLTIAGSFDSVKVTSRTYFNLVEYTLAEYYLNILGETLYCPSVAKSGYYFINVVDTCDLPFYQEYITAEGFSFGCATIDVGLSILCATGFDYITFVFKHIVIGNWLDLTGAITFTTSSKSVALCANLVPWKLDCFTIELGFGTVGTLIGGPISIGSIDIHGFAFSTKFNGVTFSAYTELDEYSTLLGSDNATWNYLNASTTLGFLVPFTSKGELGLCTDYWELADNVFALKCIPTQRIRLWEKWTISFSGDACCGGAVTATINNYFGDIEALAWYGYRTWAIGGVVSAVTDLYNWAGTAATTTQKDTAIGYSATTTAPTTYDKVLAGAFYSSSTQASLFDWAKTDIAVKIGMGSNFTLNLGLGVSSFGWGSLDLGFTFTF
jgi:hypothetical protein